jgi:DHA2 family multidrug resistance protein
MTRRSSAAERDLRASPALVMTPLSTLATGGIEQEEEQAARPRRRWMRKLAGSVGIALLQTLLARREQFQSAVINSSSSLLNEATRSLSLAATADRRRHGMMP